MKKSVSIDMQTLNELSITPTAWVFMDYLHDLSYADVYVSIHTKAVASYLGLKEKDIPSLINSLAKKGLIAVSSDNSKEIRTTEQWRSATEYNIQTIGYSESFQKRAQTSRMIQGTRQSDTHYPVTPVVQDSVHLALIERKKDSIQSDQMAYLQDADRAVREFEFQRKRLQPNFDINLCEGRYSKNAFDVMREHLYDTTHSRTPKHYFDAIRWLFGSTSKEAEFWRKSINSVSKLIQHYDAIELASISNSSDIQHSGEIQARIDLMRKHGATEQEIEQEVMQMVKGD